jgi:hypothetical protein
METLFFIVTLWSAIAIPLELWHNQRVARDEAVALAAEQRAKRFHGPNCNARYGSESLYVGYGAGSRECNLVCVACMYLNHFDGDGIAIFGRGELFDLDWTTQTSQ